MSTLRFIGRRLRQVVPVLIVVTFFTTALTDLLPGSPALAIYGAGLTKQSEAVFNKTYNLNHPLLVRYWDWVWAALHGNLGYSYINGTQSVTGQLAQRFPVTAEIALLALFISLLIAIPVAMVCALRQGRLFDRVVTAVSSFTHATPPFVSAVALVYVFSFKIQAMPAQGWVPLTQDFGENLHHAILPVATLVLVGAPTFIRVLRGDVVSLLNENFVQAARSRGLPEWYVMLRHVLRPASATLITIAGVALGALFGGSIIVEYFYSIPGLGLLAHDSVLNKDLPIVQGLVVCVCIGFIIINGLVDLSYGLIDPRVRQRR